MIRIDRRTALGAAVGATVATIGGLIGGARKVHADRYLRPPGALGEDEFFDKCARCFKCGNACPNDCIEFYEIGDGIDRAYTPYIRARSRGCTLCGKCGEVCPTGALQPIKTTREGWKETVSMGVARVNKDMCYSYHGRTCGACYRACPLAGEAMKIGVFEKPLVQTDVCVGCGLCEQACLHLPQAIRVIPRRT